MIKKLTFLAFLFAIISICCFADETFSISGEVNFTKTGNIYIQLVTEDEFNNTNSTGTASMVLKVSNDEINKKKVSFKFENIKKGKYGIRAFQDVNGNGKLDTGLFGPEEPWGTYLRSRPFMSAPKFQEMVFEIKNDISKIQFAVE